MAFSVKIIRASDFIRFDAEKRPSIAAGRDSLRALGQLCLDQGINRVLIDCRAVEQPLTIADLYTLISALPELGFPRHVWIALLPKDGYFDRAQFAGLCAANRGWRVEPFRQFEEAIEWMSVVDDAPAPIPSAPLPAKE